MASADGPCIKCDIEKVKVINEQIDNLTFTILADFLCTFDSTCINNGEYSEWSNATLFLVLRKAPKLFMDVVSKTHIRSKVIIYELENPIHDQIKLQQVYDTIKTTDIPKKIKALYLKAVWTAAEKSGETIK